MTCLSVQQCLRTSLALSCQPNFLFSKPTTGASWWLTEVIANNHPNIRFIASKTRTFQELESPNLLQKLPLMTLLADSYHRNAGHRLLRSCISRHVALSRQTRRQLARQQPRCDGRLLHRLRRGSWLASTVHIQEASGSQGEAGEASGSQVRRARICLGEGMGYNTMMSLDEDHAQYSNKSRPYRRPVIVASMYKSFVDGFGVSESEGHSSA